MKKVLIVSPNWPPVTFPDMQRARMLACHMPDQGWEPLILAIDPGQQVGVKDPLLQESLPGNLKVWLCNSISHKFTRLLGINNVGIRSIFHLAKLGSKIIHDEKPDLVFFSTTMFIVFILGPYWLKKHRVQFVLDYQDPWYVDKPVNTAGRSWPVKKRLGNWLAGMLEPIAVRNAAAIISVSPEYPRQLCARYSFLQENIFTVLPFSATTRDFDILGKFNVRQSVFDLDDGKKHWVYVGRGGDDLEFVLNGFFKALQILHEKSPERLENIAIHFIGTAYSDLHHDKTIEKLAANYGLSTLVSEQPERVTYYEALKCLADADYLLIVGSHDAGYTPSKVYPYILASKPLLALLHEKSSAIDVIRSTRSGQVVSFTDNDDVDDYANKILDKWFLQYAGSQDAETPVNLDGILAEEMTRKICEVFNQSLSIKINIMTGK